MSGYIGSKSSVVGVDSYLRTEADATFLTPAGDGSSLTGISPFKPVAVTGATPSLNVGTYNFFSQGTLTANTTVSFASVPTEARWSYSFDVGSTRLNELFNVSTASYLQSFSVAGQETSPAGIFFKPDGLKMYIAGNTGDEVNEYDLSTAWDASTAVFLQLFSVAGQDTIPYDIFFKPDGTKMYIAGFTGVDINEYNLSTAWDISTASFLQLFSVSAQDASVVGVTFKSDGTKMYMLGQDNANVNEYDLSTAWDISTAVFLQSFSVTPEDTAPRGMVFKPDGTKMFVVGSTSEGVYEYDLSTAWNVSTAVYLQVFLAATNTPDINSVVFDTDGSRMYLLDNTNDNVVQYDVGSFAAVTLPASVENPPTVALTAGDIITYDFYTLDGGTTVTIIDDNADVGISIARLGAGAIGTYVWATHAASATTTQQFVLGTTYAGTGLYPAGFGSAGASTTTAGTTKYASGQAIGVGDTASAALSGTWRAMGTTPPTASLHAEMPTCLFMRIS